MYYDTECDHFEMNSELQKERAGGKVRGKCTGILFIISRSTTGYRQKSTYVLESGQIFCHPTKKPHYQIRVTKRHFCASRAPLSAQFASRNGSDLR